MLLRHTRFRGAAAAGKAFCPFGPPEASPSSQLVLCVLFLIPFRFVVLAKMKQSGSVATPSGLRGLRGHFKVTKVKIARSGQTVTRRPSLPIKNALHARPS